MENNNNFNAQFNHGNGNFSKANVAPKSSGSGFGKSVLVPFISGIVGASLVVGVAFGIPGVQSIFKNQNPVPSQSSSASTIDYNNLNPNLVSLSSYSDTGVAVAQKVLPSVVGINVQYSVNTIFSHNTSTASAAGSGVIIPSIAQITVLYNSPSTI